MAIAERHYPLIEAAQIGDPAALDRLLQVCQPDIRRYAQRNCLMSDVDDAVQETLLILSRRVQSVRVLVAFSGWLFTIVRRECRRLERRLFGIEHLDEQKAEHWLVARSVDALRLDLVRALESLPPHYREIILLRDFEEMPIHELAQQLALTPAAVKSRLHRARQLMREYLLA
ncbi:MAG TPA: sigma-70 family RNA polymerase sigma factor [Sulfuriferula sp.]|nr:sigma-70 family RNA polymerase sigma factor [Sulfuriferula sp.]